MTIQQPTNDLLGGLNAVEEKYAPEVLYCVGRLELLRRAPRIAVIGSRKVSSRGAENAARIARVIVEESGVVVSGLAQGVDTIAHQSAIGAGGDTIAVIGTSLAESYPKANRELQALIASDHLLVSQFAEGYPTTPRNFPIRNRTMALVSHASIIVEASDKSGTRHQGWEAIRLGRELFIPRPLAEAPFDWPREMIEYGATVFDTAGDLRSMIRDSVPVSEDESVCIFST